MTRRGLVLAVLVCVAAVTACTHEVELSYAEGILELTGACFIRGIKLQADPPEGVDWPEPQGEAHYGMLSLADGRHAVMIDWAGGRSALYVDPDRSGSVAAFEWERMLADGNLLASVPLEIGFADGATAPYRLFVMWSPFTETVLTYCRDTYREGAIDLGDRRYALAVIDEDSDGRYDVLAAGVLLIDVDGDGELLASSDSHERFPLDAPFNLDGTVYRVASMAADGSRVRLEESDEIVPPKPPLLPGFPAPGFEGIDAAGEPVSLDGLRGSILVLDFWAGWCGPCLAELPTFSAIASDFADEGVIVLGINLDRTRSEFEEAVAEHGIEYRQIYDGPEGPINLLYRIEGIPMTYVIDRDGTIRGRGLRGDELRAAVEELIEEGGDGEDDPHGSQEP